MQHTDIKNKALRIALLGGFDIRIEGGERLQIGYAKLRGLLAILAMSAGVPLRREYLAELFWPGTQAAGRQNLRRALFNLKSAMGDADQLLSAERDTITLDRMGLWLDAAKFTAATTSCTTTLATHDCAPCLSQMEHMAELYRGEFMAGFTLPDCPDFEDWLQVQREILHLSSLALLEKLSNCHEQIGDYSKALYFTLRTIELEPWDEDAHRNAMRLYAQNGQNSAATGQYQICCNLLKKELDVLPNLETRQLAERIRNGELRRVSSDTAATPPMQTIPRPPDATTDRISSHSAGETTSHSTGLSKDNNRMADYADRRQVTVLYCELTATEIDDPDETIALLASPHARCAEIIRQLSGHIVQTHGGGLLAYFGYPQAHEDGARRAVRAACAVTSAAAHDIEIRAGVHTGIIITSGDSSMLDTVGKTSKLAIQLCNSAAHNNVTISQNTCDIVTGYFDSISLGFQTLPGFARPLEVFKVLRESGARTRLDAAAQLTPMTGRMTEIAMLMGLWKKTTQGSHHVVLIQGEAGMGKSRLLHALKERLTDQPHAIRELRCFPEFSQSPFHPLIAMLEAIFGFEHSDTPEIKFNKLAQSLDTHYPTSAQDAAPLLGQLLSLPLTGRHQPPGLSPQKQKERTITTLLGLLQILSARQPVLLIVEDLHWIDPSTLELLTLFVGQKGMKSILAVFTTRPEFVPPWKQDIRATLILAPLSADEVAKMIASLRADIPAGIVRCIAERTDGVPLFIEEVTKYATLDNQQCISPANIPATLHDLLAARMDKLGEAKYTAQLAATLGREFDLDLLRKVSPYAPAALAHSLNALQDAGLILKVSETGCQFKHALIQEAAYQSQTRTPRQAAHRRIAHILQSDFPDVVTTQPELLAQHFSSAGETRQSIGYWVQAGQRAARNSANLEAIGHFNSGRQLLLTLPPGQDRDRAEFKILITLCPVLYATKGYGSEEATQANERIFVLSRLVGDSPELFQAKWAFVMNTIASVGPRVVPSAAMQLLDMAHADPLRKQAAHYAVADAAFWLGDFKSTRTHAEQVIALYHPDHHQMLLEQFGEDLSISCMAYLSWTLYFLGFQDQAQRVCKQMLEQARKLAHPHSLALALCFASVLHRWLNKCAKALTFSEKTIAVSRQHDFCVWLAAGEMTHGWAQVMHEQEEGIAKLKSSIALMRTAVGGLSIVFLSALIEAYVYLKLSDEALELIAQAQEDEASTGDGHFTAELHRLKGVCLLEISASNMEKAEACFSQALAISSRQGAKSLELRATMNMARLWQQQGKQKDARHMLEKIYNWFTEGFDTPDLRAAAKLLRALV